MKVYIADLSATISPHSETILSATDYAQAYKISNPLRRRRFIKSRTLRRQILSHELQCPAADIDFIVANGKPGLADEKKLQFSTSYSGSLMALAISNEPIGVDLEEIEVGARNEEVVGALFHEQEIQQFSGKSGIERAEAFYAMWTQKEAFAKALGRGMDIDFRNFAVFLEGGKVVCGETICTDHAWYSKPLLIHGNFTLGIASRYPDPQIDIQDWPNENDRHVD